MKFAVNDHDNEKHKHSDNRHRYNPIRSHPVHPISQLLLLIKASILGRQGI